MSNRSSAILLTGAFVTVAVCAYFFGKHVGTKQQAWRSAVEAHHVAVEHCQALGKEVNNQLRMARRARMPLAQFKEEFGEPVAVSRGEFPEAAEDDTHVFTHEASHRVFYLRFADDVLVGYHGSHGADDIQPHLPSIEERLAQMR